MAKVVTKYYGDDGTEFPSMQEAIDYDFLKQIKNEFGFSDDVCKKILEGYGRLHYFIIEYMKNFPDTGCT
jgi:hypothetical protein